MDKQRGSGSFDLSLLAPAESFSSFEIARNWVWERKIEPDEIQFFGKSDHFFPFLGLLRYQVFLGIRSLEPGVTAEMLKIKPDFLDKIRASFQRRPVKRLREFLELAFSIEKEAKQHSFHGQTHLLQLVTLLQ